jgi:hypothetical protein
MNYQFVIKKGSDIEFGDRDPFSEDGVKNKKLFEQRELFLFSSRTVNG